VDSGEAVGTNGPQSGPASTTPPDATEGPRIVVRQQSLPIPWQLAQTGNAFDERNFAHPAEVTFSRILNFYRVRWSYEPTTFALAYNPEGQPSEMFTPDFYLPELRMYVELTTMRQRLVTRKNRKLRRLRELYPDIRIKLLYRRDCERLGDAYRTSPIELSECHIGRTLFSEELIAERIASLADAITVDPLLQTDRLSRHQRSLNFPVWPMHAHVPLPIWQSAPSDHAPTSDLISQVSLCTEAEEVDDRLIVMSVDRGSAMFANQLAAALDERGVSITHDRVTLTRHMTPLGEKRVKIARGPRQPFAGRRILLIADAVSTGLSHTYLTAWLRRRGAASVEICTLLDRKSARLVDVPVRYAAFDAPNDLLVGYGLHLRSQFRHLPYIATLVSEPISIAAD